MVNLVSEQNLNGAVAELRKPGESQRKISFRGRHLGEVCLIV